MAEQPAGLLRRFLGSLITAAVVGFTVFMALVLTLADGLTPQEVVLAVETRVNRTVLELRPAWFGATPPPPTATASPEPTPGNSASASAAIRPPVCQPPAGWVPMTVARTDTLLRLAIRFNLGAVALMEANCLSNDALIPGTTLYVPAAPLPTRTPAPTADAFACGPPGDWVLYQVRPNDNLFRISLDLGVSIANILQANCREVNDITLTAGEQIYLPGIPVNSGPPTPVTGTPTVTSVPTNTPRPSATGTPAPTNTPPPTGTATPTPPNTPTPPPPATMTPTNTPITPSATPTNTAAPPTPTQTPTSTSAPPTATASPTNTATASPTNTPTHTATPTPTNTAAPPTATATTAPPTATPTPTP